jgi:hypothetical protein
MNGIRLSRGFIALALLCNLVACSSSGQRGVADEISGQVFAPTGHTVRGATVTACRSQHDCPAASVVEASGTSGAYRLEGVPAGQYAVIAFKDTSGDGAADIGGCHAEAADGTCPTSVTPGSRGVDVVMRVLGDGGANSEVEALLLKRPIYFAGYDHFAWVYVFGVNERGEKLGMYHAFANKMEQYRKSLLWSVAGSTIDILFGDGLTRTRAEVLAYDVHRDQLLVDVGSWQEVWHGCDSSAIPAAIPQTFVRGICALLP